MGHIGHHNEHSGAEPIDGTACVSTEPRTRSGVRHRKLRTAWTGQPTRFTREQIEQIARTVHRVPEVMVKVSGGAKTTWGAEAHFQYISRQGELEVETDDGERLQGKDVAAKLVEDWDLEIDAGLNRWRAMERGGRRQTKLVHNIILSMPSGTSPNRLLAASRDFAREEFALMHRYAMVLHTDQAHPHVHLVVSAYNLEGTRLNIRKSDLRRWREQLARHLRQHGIEANATPSQIRGRLSDFQKDGIFGPHSAANLASSGNANDGRPKLPS